ncbi:hypothetical protein [Archangium sp.]|uniref:hypothetical protein n=1 Tax=Archangium sp. TaxID=1872627 RepID=UPI00286A61B9|nr:hypothetical protein [Archangium sp.]
MTDKPVEEKEAPEKKETQGKTLQERLAERMNSSSQDGLLQALAALIERMYPMEIGVGVTLTVGGTLISGSLISGQWYFAQLAEQLKASPQPAPAFAAMPETFREALKINLAKENEPFVSNFVHLMDARVHAPGQMPIPTGGKGALWRGRIDAVDGFMWGLITAG